MSFCSDKIKQTISKSWMSSACWHEYPFIYKKALFPFDAKQTYLYIVYFFMSNIFGIPKMIC